MDRSRVNDVIALDPTTPSMTASANRSFDDDMSRPEHTPRVESSSSAPSVIIKRRKNQSEAKNVWSSHELHEESIRKRHIELIPSMLSDKVTTQESVDGPPVFVEKTASPR